MIIAIGKCPVRGCKTVNRGQFTDATDPLAEPGFERWKLADQCYINRRTFDGLNNTPASTMTYWFVHEALVVAGGWICEEHDRFLVQKPVSAMPSPSPCRSLCWHSTSLRCACACNGANHGISWASGRVEIQSKRA